ncbi:MAG: PIG-L family deacetylase [Thermoplasmata archaeon]|nr:PIG-L family deacetylase [Thermoplasmata archaeon]
MKVLAIVAHPDDEVLGCGGTLARHVDEGDEVYVCIGTRPSVEDYGREMVERKREEVMRVHGFLGVRKTFFAGLPTKKLDVTPHEEIISKISAAIGDLEPDIIYTHHRGDVNLDHRRLFEAIMVIFRPKPGRKNPTIYSFEVPSSTEWGIISQDTAFIPNYFVDISGYLEQKKKALAMYETEVKSFPHPRSPEAVEYYARKWGAGVGLEAAEPFSLLRKVRGV